MSVFENARPLSISGSAGAGWEDGGDGALERFALPSPAFAELDDVAAAVEGDCWLERIPPKARCATRCARTNVNLRAEARVDGGRAETLSLRIADVVANGRVVVFDPSFEHERWHHGEDFAVLLVCEVAHPGVSPGS